MNVKKLLRIYDHQKIPRHKIEKIRKMKRKKFHPMLHRTHKKHRISYRTLYYIKSYGKEMHVWHAILRQSIGILLFASVVSTFGGLWLQSLEAKITVFLPLLIMIPALDDMTGDFGTIISSKFTTYLFTGKIRGKWYKAFKVQELTLTIYIIALISSVYISVVSSLIALFSGFPLSFEFFIKLLGISVLSTMLVVTLLTAISFAGGYLIFKRGDDPNNFLIPITTAVADFSCLAIFSYAVITMF